MSHPLRDPDGNGEFSRQVYLHPGEMEYKFVVDGEWIVDPECQSPKPNDQGTLNSVVNVV